MSESLFKRFGGTITPGCDQLLEEPRILPDNALCFSHGRAAMIWLLHNAGKFDSAAVCAYTWPEIPNMMRRYNCEVGFFDFEQEKVRRMTDMFTNNKDWLTKQRKDFVLFIDEYDKRRGKNFIETFPEMEDFYNLCKKII